MKFFITTSTPIFFTGSPSEQEGKNCRIHTLYISFKDLHWEVSIIYFYDNINTCLGTLHFLPLNYKITVAVVLDIIFLLEFLQQLHL